MSNRWNIQTARQEHIAAALEKLADHGIIDEWDVEFWRRPKGTSIAMWYIDGECSGDTWTTERHVMNLMVDAGIVWVPVAHPGGEAQRKEALAEIARRTI